MIKYTSLDDDIKGVVFELDNVLFPEKDYDLQVFYLFANFLEYLEQFPPANDVVEFMSKRYEIHGSEGMFDEVQKTFGIDVKYKENLKLLFANAKLPLKLLLYKEILELLQELVINRKHIFILTRGEVKKQLNKITQTEWNGLEKYLKVYFTEEFNGDFKLSLENLAAQNQLNISDLCFVGTKDIDEEDSKISGIRYLSVKSTV